MKNYWKRLSSTILVFAMVASLVNPVTVKAEEPSNAISSEEVFVSEVVSEDFELAEPDLESLNAIIGGLEAEDFEYFGDIVECDTYEVKSAEFDSVKQEAYAMSSGGTRYFYNQLPANERAWWDAMDAACYAYLNSTANVSTVLNGSSYVLPWADLGASLDYDGRIRLLELFRYSNPQYYFVKNTIWRSGTNLTFEVYSIFQNGQERQKVSNAIQNKVNDYLSYIDADMLPEEKERVLHDLVVSRVSYVSGTYDQSAYSALYLNKTVCAGYTMTMSLLLNQAGIPALGVAGTGNGGNHAWNMVYIYDDWYYLDVTWDDTAGSNSWYNLSYANMMKDHALGNVYTKMVPSSVSNSRYNPYLVGGDFRYFIVNNGSGTKKVRLVDLLNDTLDTDVPSSVTYKGEQYVVIGNKVPSFAERIYVQALGRTPDAGGLRYWTYNLVNQRITGAVAVGSFLCGAEVMGYGLPNEEFVARAYRTVLNRQPDANDTGFWYWINLLNNAVSREYVVKSFGQSAEFGNLCAEYGIVQGSIYLPEQRDQNENVTMYVFRCYTTTLSRHPSVDELNYWCGVINTRQQSASSVAENFVFSPEFVGRNYDNTTYLQILYRMFFGRDADQAGLNYWLGAMGPGGNMSRRQVFEKFVGSNEFASILASFGL